MRPVILDLGKVSLVSNGSNDLINGLIDWLSAVEVQLRVFWLLEWVTNSGEVLDDTFTSLLVQTLAVSILTFSDGSVHVDLEIASTILLDEFPVS